MSNPVKSVEAAHACLARAVGQLSTMLAREAMTGRGLLSALHEARAATDVLELLIYELNLTKPSQKA